MSTLVVYESIWGNTRAVAEAIAAALGEDVQLLDVADAPSTLPDDVDLLVVGGPTHAFSMSRPNTRSDAARRGAPLGHESTGIREWLAAQPTSDRAAVAVFDTRVAKVRRLPGSAAKAAAKLIRRHHPTRVVATESFYVEDMAGQLLDGELDRARAWAGGLMTHGTRGAPSD